ncbi:Rieske (2Fe-2S) protein [Candidatus Halobonum tyrrellensis]|uniref:Ferredoxin subunit of nitrite reductase and ring-hydroxylating dioxygenase n=1 Tax=Candidatus Halobonum tyrrellensis G22 TaxID=1324957 RepID=V4HPT2_9EURY|nr:Rieske 2Fe-2S domain-containing protein [Candidatus Halobonum tyrrellensis]ESP89919.1 ferredoxin subunit of nitrite reductase and ring-hydroxylating dioxygenase [Candidatus Halobonum tyrrellensis G22]
MDPGRRITAVENVPADTTFLFTLRDESGETDEAVLTRVDTADGSDGDDGEDDDDGEHTGGDRIAGWINRCMHFTHIRLDKGSGAPKRAGELVCANHSAMFEGATGRCTHGPCEGAYLDGVDVTVRDGDVYLTDDGYEFVAAGGVERDPADLTSTSNVKF